MLQQLLPTEQTFLRYETAVENEYLKLASEQLVERLRDTYSHDDRIALIAVNLGIPKLMAAELVATGVSIPTLTTLTIIPMVLVAWADGGVTSKERQAILELARECSIKVGSPSYQLLNAWLSQRPPSNLETAWKKYVLLVIAHAPAEVRRAIQDKVVKRCEATAKACGGFLGFRSVSKAEQAKIDEISILFNRPQNQRVAKAASRTSR
jgi:hypothetical protein